MKALTLLQPGATLVAIGAKRIETRPVKTAYRGPVAIHAAAGDCYYPKHLATARHPAFVDKLRGAGYEMVGRRDGRDEGVLPSYERWDVPHSCILAVTTITDCVRVEALEDSPISVWEYTFGDYRPGRWAWKLGPVYELGAPITCRGSQGLWKLPAEANRELVLDDGLRAFLGCRPEDIWEPVFDRVGGGPITPTAGSVRIPRKQRPRKGRKKGRSVV